jgi:hypothetical protein
LLFPENIGKRLSINETSLSNGELYTILTNKAAQGKKGSIVAMIARTKADTVISIIDKIPIKARNQVTAITLYMAGNMGSLPRNVSQMQRVLPTFLLIYCILILEFVIPLR